MQRLFLALVLGVFSSAAQAVLVEYTYTGSAFDTVTGLGGAYEAGVDNISGSFIIDDADMISLSNQNVYSSIVSFSFDDGSSGAPFSSTITDTDAVPPTNFVFTTDASGNIVQWDIFLARDASDRWMSWCNTQDGCTGSGTDTRDLVNNRASGVTNNNGASSDTPGAWSAAAPVVPIPAAAWLFGSALGLLGWMRRKAT